MFFCVKSTRFLIISLLKLPPLQIAYADIFHFLVLRQRIKIIPNYLHLLNWTFWNYSVLLVRFCYEYCVSSYCIKNRFCSIVQPGQLVWRVLVPWGDVLTDTGGQGAANSSLFWRSGRRWSKSGGPCWVTILSGKWNLQLSGTQEDPTSPRAKFIQAFLCGAGSSRFIWPHPFPQFLLGLSFCLDRKTWHHLVLWQ